MIIRKKGFRKSRISCILLSLIIMFIFMTRMIADTLADAGDIVTTGSISGLLWVDEDKQPETDRDGLYNGNEQPLAGYTVYLHPADDLTKVIAVTQTDEDGKYTFSNIEPDRYVLGLLAGTVNDIDYRLPEAVTKDSKFETDSKNPLVAYSDIIELEAGQDVKNINAGIRPIIKETNEIEDPNEGGEVVIPQDPDEGGEIVVPQDPDESGEGIVPDESANTVNEKPALTETPDSTVTPGPANVTNTPLRPSARGASYTIDVTNYSNLNGTGYSFNQSTGTLTFTTAAAGNSYTLMRGQASAGMVTRIVFSTGGSPASVTINGLVNLTNGLTIPADFAADLTFNRDRGTDVILGTPLILPTGYRGRLEINGLDVPSLTFPSDYNLPITFNGITASNGINYPANYNQPITIAGRNFNVTGNQFPAAYSGSITIGGGAAFTGTHTICRPGTNPGTAAGIFLPNTISAITVKNATTDSNGKLNIQLGATDHFQLLLAGSSEINGYINVPANAHLTIDSADNPNTGSENGRLGITSGGLNACIGGDYTANSGLILIQGGTVEATQVCGDLYPPAAIGSGSTKSGKVTITGGRVIATGNGQGAAIGSGAGSNSSVEVTITGGLITAYAGINSEGNSYGAAIGGGNYTVGNVKVLITGGTIDAATAHNRDFTVLGSDPYYGAGIGGGNAGFADVTISGGYVVANSAHGAGIGNGYGENINLNRGSVKITGQSTIRGYSLDAANIGKGFGTGYVPTYWIDKEADIMMYSRGYTNQSPNVKGSGGNLGDGYFVSLFFLEQIRGNMYIYNDGNLSTLVRTIPINVNDRYMSVLFSTGHNTPENFRVFVDFYDPFGSYYGMRQIVHYYDHVVGGTHLTVKETLIPSVKNMGSYKHQFHNDSWDALIVAMDDGQGAPTPIRVTEKYCDNYGTPIQIQGRSSNEVIINRVNGIYTYTRTIPNDLPAEAGYIKLGYKWDSPPNNTGNDYLTTNISQTLSANRTIYFVYKVDAGIGSVTISKVVTGHFINKSKDFEFTVYFTDSRGNKLSQGTQFTYTGKTVPNMGAIAPAGGTLTLDGDGKATFTLKHGQAITILNVPGDAKIKIVETTYNNFRPSFIDSSGAIEQTNDTNFRVVGACEHTFEFFNGQITDPIPTGISGF